MSAHMKIVGFSPSQSDESDGLRPSNMSFVEKASEGSSSENLSDLQNHRWGTGQAE